MLTKIVIQVPAGRREPVGLLEAKNEALERHPSSVRLAVAAFELFF